MFTTNFVISVFYAVVLVFERCYRYQGDKWIQFVNSNMEKYREHCTQNDLHCLM